MGKQLLHAGERQAQHELDMMQRQHEAAKSLCPCPTKSVALWEKLPDVTCEQGSLSLQLLSDACSVCQCTPAAVQSPAVSLLTLVEHVWCRTWGL